MAELKTTQFDIYFCTSRQRRNNGHRDQANAIALRCVPIDIDVGPNNPKKYATLAEAIDALFRFCDELKIPRPSFLVASGGGLHAYWLSDRTLSVEEWQPFANAIKTAAKTANLKFDASVTGDAARVLRVPGTFNYKYDDGPRPVRLLQEHCNGMRHDFAVVFSNLLDIEPVGPLGPSAEAFKSLERKSLSEGITVREIPPLPLDPILAECAWLREAHDTGGKEFDQPQWNLTTLVATSLEDGHELAHAFGNKHPDYVHGKTEEIWERKNRERAEKNIGWPSCKAIQDAGSQHCRSCPHFAAGKSPLNLALQWEQERRAKQIAENIKIGDDVTEPLLPQIMTLKEMHARLVFIGSTGGVADLITGRVRKKEHALDEYAASKHTYMVGNTLKEAPALKLWTASKNRMTVEVLAWVPGAPQICRPPEGQGPAFNTWRGLSPMAFPEDWQVRVEPFLEHVDFLVPIEQERERFLQWLAHIGRCPEVLPHTGYLMTTPTTGTGRNLLASILVRALRGFVAAGISLPELLDGGFTGRLSKKLLAIVDEAREGSGERRYQRATRLTSLLNEEHRHQSVEKNCCRWLMFSNHADAIPFDNSDRRVVVIANPTTRKSDAYYERLYGLLADNAFIGSVRHWLENKDITAFRPGEHAPMNQAKLQVLNEMMSETERAVAEFKEDCKTELTSRDAIKNHVSDVITRNGRTLANVNDMHLTHAIRRAGMTSTGRRIMAYRKNTYSGTHEEIRLSIVIVRGEWTTEIIKRADPRKLLEAMGIKDWAATKPQR